MQAIDYVQVFNASPVGPATILRLLAAAVNPQDPSEVVELAHVDVMVDEEGSHVGTPSVRTFGRRAGAALSASPACTPEKLALAAWAPYPPDALVAFDVSATQLAFLPALTGRLPWIGLLRAVRRAWPGMDRSTLPDILAERGHAAVSEHVIKANPTSPGAQELLQSAYLLEHMLAANDVRWAEPPDGDPAERLRPILGGLATEYVVQNLINLSVAPGEPRGFPPGPWDPGEWTRIPLDDVIGFGQRPDTAWQGDAQDEARRRLDAAGLADLPNQSPRVVLRRVAEHLGKARYPA